LEAKERQTFAHPAAEEEEPTEERSPKKLVALEVAEVGKACFAKKKLLVEHEVAV